LITQTIAGDLIPQIWETEVEYQQNPKRGVIKYVNDMGSKYFGPGKTINVPVIPFLPTANVKTTYPTVTYADPTTTTVVQYTPTVIYTGFILQEDTILTTLKDAVQLYAPLLAEGLYQKLDTDILGLHASTGATVADAGVWTYANFAVAGMTLMARGGDKVAQGDMMGIYHTHTWDDWFNSTNVISAQVRGETNGPAKTGVFDTVLGIRVFFTTNVVATGSLDTASASKNLIFARKWCWVVRKNTPKVEVERTDLTTKVMASHMMLAKVQHTALGVLHTVATT